MSRSYNSGNMKYAKESFLWDSLSHVSRGERNLLQDSSYIMGWIEIILWCYDIVQLDDVTLWQ
jgi:hypothetical protein